MTRYESIVRTLVEPLVTDKTALMIRETPNDDGKSVTVNVFAAKNDIAVLIGRKGTIATALRETLPPLPVSKITSTCSSNSRD